MSVYHVAPSPIAVRDALECIDKQEWPFNGLVAFADVAGWALEHDLVTEDLSELTDLGRKMLRMIGGTPR